MRKVTLLPFALALLLGTPGRADTKAIWMKQCKQCHGEDGTAKTSMGTKEKIKDMTTPQWQAKFSDSRITDVITNGSADNKKMKAFKDKITPAEVADLVKFIRGLKK